jgi:DNA polymerase III alpha subunit
MKIVSSTRRTIQHEGFLKERFGDHFAQISAVTTMKLRSSVKDVARVTLGKVPFDIETLTKKFLNAPQGIGDKEFVFGYEDGDGSWITGSIEYDKALQEYVRKYGDQWKTVQLLFSLGRQVTRHASAFVVGNQPISDLIPLQKISGVNCTQYTAPGVEWAGGIKMDFLVVNALEDLSSSLKMLRDRDPEPYPEFAIINGRRVPKIRLIRHKGELRDIYALPEEQEVFKEIAAGHTESVFQFSTPGARQWLRYFNKEKPDGNKVLDSIDQMAIFTALDRPGPLDVKIDSPDGGSHNALVEYVRRSTGEEWANTPDCLKEILPETKGLLIFQENVEKTYRYLTDCSGPEAEEFRSNVSKKKKDKIIKAYSFYLPRATEKVGEEEAKRVWDFIETFSQYGFCLAHSRAYSVTAYACAFLKYHHHLEWWTAVLKNASKDEINETFWHHCGHLIKLPDLGNSTQNFEIVGDMIQAPLSLLHGIGEKAHHQIQLYRPYTDVYDFCRKIHQHKEINATIGIKLKTKKRTKKDKITGEKVTTIETSEIEHKTLGRSSLNQGTIYTLIIAGAMDSLFEPGLTLVEQLAEYERAMAEVSGAKLKPVKPEYVNVGPLERYQIRKSILPAYSMNLTQTVTDLKVLDIKINDKGSFKYWHEKTLRSGEVRKEDYKLVDFNELERINSLPVLPNDGIKFAVIAYVESSERFSYQNNQKEAFKGTFDINGGRMELVKWGGREGKIDKALNEERLTGAIVVMILSKFAVDRPITIDEVKVIQEPLNLKGDE